MKFPRRIGVDDFVYNFYIRKEREIVSLQTIRVLSLSQLGPLDAQTDSSTRTASIVSSASLISKYKPAILGQSGTQTAGRRVYSSTQCRVQYYTGLSVAGSGDRHGTIPKYSPGTATGGAYQRARKNRSTLIVQTRENDSATTSVGGETLSVYPELIDNVGTNRYVDK
jgi:hypothetical protein